jgi:uncharacterized protein YecT (DUF1311 family)
VESGLEQQLRFRMKLETRMLRFATCSTALLAISMISAPAFSDEPTAESVAAIKACTDLAANNGKTGPSPPDELEEKAGAVGRLDAAAEAARRAPASCIGAWSTACIQKAGNMSNGVLNDCYSQEAAAWDKRLNVAYGKASSRMEKDAFENLRKVQLAWIAWRDASCKQPYLVFQGTMAGPMEAWCKLDITARQAIWMEGWLW